mgnify:FL=1
MNRGDICLAHFPFTDASAAKLRPVLIVSVAKASSGDDIIVLPISSSPDKSDPFCVFVDRASPHFAATGLRNASSIKWSKPMTIAKSVITRRLGKLHNDILRQVTSQLVSAIF